MKILTPADFAARLKKGEASKDILIDDAGAVKAKLVGLSASLELAAAEDRSVNFTISTGSIDRYNSTIAPEGWQLDNYARNSVVLWAHDDSIPAIGRAEETKIDGTSLRSRAIFADRDTHPLADTVFRLIKAGFINGASVGWIPLEWKFVEDRGFGVDYTQQELLEWSVVNIPANPECLKEARSIGIDTKPLLLWAERTLDQADHLLIPRKELELLRKGAGSATMSRPSQIRADGEDWKCGAARDLPIEDDDSWDGPAAEKAIFSDCGFDGDSPDTAKARKAFLCYDASAPDQRGSYKLPFAKIVDGKLKASASGIRAAASRLPQTDIPDGVKDEARKVLDAYEAKMGGDEDKAFDVAARAARTLLDAGAITHNEFADLIMRSARALVVRAGRVLSQDNEDKLRKAHEHCLAAVDHCQRACEHVMGVVSQNSDSGDDNPDDDGDEDPEHPSGDDDNDPDDGNADRSAQEMRQRRIRLLKLSASSLALRAGLPH